MLTDFYEVSRVGIANKSPQRIELIKIKVRIRQIGADFDGFELCP
jgi:hypothetical protein